MFEGQRLQYIVPGYTGHVPHKVYEDNVPLQDNKPTSKIPGNQLIDFSGYAGYVKGIKPQNLYANTFGKITLSVAQQSYVKGQDVDPKYKYISTQQQVNIPPSQMLQRTAADIVGVPNKQVLVQPVNLILFQPSQLNPNDTNQFTITQSESFKQRLAEQKTRQMSNSKVVFQDGKEYVKLQNPIPGYTGFARRVMANNIFGKTFAESVKEAVNDTEKLLHEKKKNFNNQINTEPPLKF